jgi:hypothetical protein
VSAAICTHPRDYFDREICYCGVMHYRCMDCGETVDACQAATDAGRSE